MCYSVQEIQSRYETYGKVEMKASEAKELLAIAFPKHDGEYLSFLLCVKYTF